MDFRDIMEFFRDTFKYIIVAVVVLLLFIFVVGFQQVMGPSMRPTFKQGDIVLLNKLIYKFRDVQREDVVVVMVKDKYMIKRVIGLPGETIEYKDSVLYINGRKYDETYIDSSVKTTINTDNGETSTFKIIVPEGKYFVLGDNREESEDSRNYGTIEKKNIYGKVFLRFWPINTFKFY